MPEVTAPFLEVAHLSKNFNVKANGKKAILRAVHDISFTIDRCETLGLVGESGCGKSTTGRLVINLLEPTSGMVKLEGQDIFAAKGPQKKALRRKMQIIFQDPYASLDPRMKIWDTIAEPLIIHNLAKGQALHNRVNELLGYVGLSVAQSDRFPHEFSGGQRQRIGIARALAVDPQFIVCDEPVSALDVSVQSQVLNLLKDLQRELGLTYLFIAHGLNVIKHMSDRVGVMYLGQIVELSPAHALYEDPLHPYTQALLSAIPIPDPTIERERFILEGNVPSPIDPPEGCAFCERCPYSDEICRTRRPDLAELAPGHWVACHKVDTSTITSERSSSAFAETETTCKEDT
ncbi:MAG: ATP-binding cassette domain-containing protein [Coriobacteriia bacterium]|nr:ATP-binding cassette domain-containing protein [Coriobacteriia bacterium]